MSEALIIELVTLAETTPVPAVEDACWIVLDALSPQPTSPDTSVDREETE